jgi:DNA-binding response OmpR family regulator
MASSPTMDLASETPAIIEFGHFRVVPRRRELLADGQPIRLGGRSFDVLMTLIEGQGAVVSKDAIRGKPVAEMTKSSAVLDDTMLTCALA